MVRILRLHFQENYLNSQIVSLDQMSTVRLIMSVLNRTAKFGPDGDLCLTYL